MRNRRSLHRTTLVALCIILALILTGCLGGSGRRATFNVVGTVSTPESTPIPGATVRVNDHKTTTGSDGTFVLTRVPTRDGRARYRADAPGYLSRSGDVHIRAGETLELHIQLTPGQSIGTGMIAGRLNFAVPTGTYTAGLLEAPPVLAPKIKSPAAPPTPTEVIVELFEVPTLEAARSLAAAVGAADYRISQHIERILLTIPPDVDELTFIQRLMAQPGVADAYPNDGLFITVNPIQPNDPYYYRQHHLRHINAPLAWSVTTGDRNIVVAVLDSGVDTTHPDLAHQLLPGWNILEEKDDVTDDTGHGTHVAGIIGAIGDNGRGVAGVAWDVSILPVKVIDSGRGTLEDLVAGIRYAVDQGADILSMSLGIEQDRPPLREAIAYAAERGVVLVAAVGNTGQGFHTTVYPARYEEVIGVGAVSALNPTQSAEFSLRGPGVDLVAPGEAIWSTVPSGYNMMTGTSMATPVVSGVAALMLANGIPPAAVSDALRRTAVRIGDPEENLVDMEIYGYGLLNAYGAVLNVDPMDAVVFVIDNGGTIVGSVTSPDPQRAYTLAGVPTGQDLHLAAWIDVNASGELDPGDYFATSPVYLSADAGQEIDLSLSVYGVELELGELKDQFERAVRELGI